MNGEHHPARDCWCNPQLIKVPGSDSVVVAHWDTIRSPAEADQRDLAIMAAAAEIATRG